MDLDLVAHGAPGTGPALMIDALGAALREAFGSELNPTVRYLSGDHGAEAIIEVGRQRGDGALASSCTPTFITDPVTFDLPASLDDMTPLSALVSDAYVIVTSAERAPSGPADFFSRDTRVGISPRGGNTHIQSHLLSGVLESTITAIEYEERSEVVQEIIRGELDWTTGVSSDFLDLFADGVLVPVATFLPATAARHPRLPDTPSLAESGIDVEFVLWRGLVGPADIEPSQIRDWERRVARARDTAAWRDYLERAGLTDLALDAGGFSALLSKERVNYLGWLRDLA